MTRYAFLAVMLGLMVPDGQAQSVRSLINEGNDLYEESRFNEAEIRYRKALQAEDILPGRFNLGNALHKQGKFEESVRSYESVAAGAEDNMVKADALFNRGNSFLESGQYDAAIQSYIESLKVNPADNNAKYNLSYAILKRQEQQQQKQDQNDQSQQNQKENQQNQDKENQDKQNQQQDPQEQQQEQEQKNQPRDQRQMSQSEAERILEVLKNNEKDVQKKLRSKARARAKSEKDW